MSTTFTKLFSSITESTVWCEPHGTRITWITMLAMADRQGRVFAAIPGLANRARVTIPECEAALATFMAPDPYSRTPDHDGKRIEPIDGGWRLLNHAKYREIRDQETTRAAKREHMRRVREEKKINSTCGNTNPTMERGGDNAEAEADTDKSKSKNRARPAPLVIPSWLPADAWDDWHQYRNSRKGWTAKARQLSLRKLTTLHGEGHDPRAVIEQSIEQGWTGLWPVRQEDSRGTNQTVAPRRESLCERGTRKAIEQELADRGRHGAIGHDDARTVGADAGDVWPQVGQCVR